MTNGQAFVLHIWDSVSCKPHNGDPWSESWTLLNYITHKTGIAKRGLLIKIQWLEYILSF